MGTLPHETCEDLLDRLSETSYRSPDASVKPSETSDRLLGGLSEASGRFGGLRQTLRGFIRALKGLRQSLRGLHDSTCIMRPSISIRRYIRPSVHAILQNEGKCAISDLFLHEILKSENMIFLLFSQFPFHLSNRNAFFKCVLASL